MYAHPLIVTLVAVGFVAGALLISAFFMVQQCTAGVIERFGRFHRVAEAGIRLKFPFVDRVITRVNLRIQQIDVEIEAKTEDHGFIRVVVAVEYFVHPQQVYQSFYKLDDIDRQLKAFTFDAVRTQIPKLRMDDVFARKDDLSLMVRAELSQVLAEFGYGILKVLVIDIVPDSRIKASMNEVHAAQNARLAAVEEGEADRLRRVMSAEGDAQSKALEGRGRADQRHALVCGMRDSIVELQRSIPGFTSEDVMHLLLMSQYFDVLREIGASSGSRTVLIPHSPGYVSTVAEQMRTAMTESGPVVVEPGANGRPGNGAGFRALYDVRLPEPKIPPR